MTKLDEPLEESPIQKIRKHLLIKKIKVKDKEYSYYYIKGKVGVERIKKTIEVYVCPTSCKDEELNYYYCLAYGKLLFKIFKFSYDLSKKLYSTQYIDDKDIFYLEILGVGYNMLLKQFGKSDLERYNEVVFTKYVYGTTSIEGNTYTLRETDLTLNEGLTVSGKEKREFYEIENYGKLKKYLDSLKRFRLNIQLIKKIHAIIMENIDTDSAGDFRKINVGIQGSEYEPPPAVAVEGEMNNLMKWYEQNEGKLHPVELAGIFHQKFEEMHPFKDGNGRVGRELVRIILKENGYPSIFIDTKNREKYLKCLDEGNKGDHKPLCNFIVKNLMEVHDGLIKEAEEVLRKDEERIKQRCKKCITKEKCIKLNKEIAKEFQLLKQSQLQQS